MDINLENSVVKVVDCRGPLCVIDDDDSMRWSITALLDSLNFDAHGFSGGQEFLDSGLAHTCVCLISDVKMKKMSGFQLYEALTNLGQPVPVIFISGHADDSMRKKAITLGATALLDKPFNDEVLLQLVEKILAAKSDR